MHTSYVCRSIFFPYVYNYLVITHIMKENLSNRTERCPEWDLIPLRPVLFARNSSSILPGSFSLSQFSAFPPACWLHLQSPSTRHPPLPSSWLPTWPMLPSSLPTVDFSSSLPNQSPCSLLPLAALYSFAYNPPLPSHPIVNHSFQCL